MHPRAAVAPARRRYGASYPDTADLDLPQLAVWIMSELVACAHDPDTGLSPHVRYAAKVNPRCAAIRFTVFGLRDDERFEFPDAPAEQVIAHHAEPIIHAHNWSTPGACSDHRFTYDLRAPEEYVQQAERDRGRGPGTVTVLDTDDAGWWWQ